MNRLFFQSYRLRLLVLLTAWLLLGAKCTDMDVTDPKLAATMTDLNVNWRTSYQQMLAEIGSRHFEMEPDAAFSGMRKLLESMGYRVMLTEGNYYLAVSIPAEQMFTEQEWREIRRMDEPEMKRIATRHLGVKGAFAQLEPDGLMINGTVTLMEASGGTDISITFRLRPIKPLPPESILPRREYPPPYAARTGYEKIWRNFEQQVVPLADLSKQG